MVSSMENAPDGSNRIDVFTKDDARWEQRVHDRAPAWSITSDWSHIGALGTADFFVWFGDWHQDDSTVPLEASQLVAHVVSGDASTQGPFGTVLDHHRYLRDVVPLTTEAGVTTTYLLQGTDVIAVEATTPEAVSQ